MARRRLHEFVMQAWHVLEPDTPFVDGLHVRAICEHLQAVTEGRIRHLIINVPPGHAKSLLTAVFWPTWVWISHPQTRWLFSSHREPLATRDSLKCRRLIESSWYQERWGDRYQLTLDQNQKNRFESTRTGYRVVVPMNAGTGERGDYVVVDDPHTVDQAESDVQRQSSIEWWNGSMSTRLNNLSTGHFIVIQQRLHELDLTGDLLQKGGYEHLCLPAEFEPDRRCTTSIGWSDPRTAAGELLWPQRQRQKDLDGLKRSLGSYHYAGQYQQRPSPAEGGIFKRSWWRYWRPAHLDLPPVQVRMPNGELVGIETVQLPERFDQVIESWDLAFKDQATSDCVAGGVWGAVGADRFLLDQRCERLDMPATLQAIRDMSKKWPQAGVKLVEDRANGPAVLALLQHEIPGLIAVNPEGGKVARAQAVSPQIESGNVYLPHPLVAPWVEGFIEECASFPKGRHDDQVDQMTQALNRLRRCGTIYARHESEICIPPFAIPDFWPRAYGMYVNREVTAALWGAKDPNTRTIYLYAEHLGRHVEARKNVAAIQANGKWIRGVVDAACLGATDADRWRMIQNYCDLGLNVILAEDAHESGIHETRQLLENDQLKVFNNLTHFLAEYRAYQCDEKARAIQGCEQLLACFHALILSRRTQMTVWNNADMYDYDPAPVAYGPRSWMA